MAKSNPTRIPDTLINIYNGKTMKHNHNNIRKAFVNLPPCQYGHHFTQTGDCLNIHFGVAQVYWNKVAKLLHLIKIFSELTKVIHKQRLIIVYLSHMFQLHGFQYLAMFGKKVIYAEENAIS